MGNRAPTPRIPAISCANLVGAGAAARAEGAVKSAQHRAAATETSITRHASVAASGANRRSAQLVSALALALALLLPGAARAEPEETLARFTGSWHWVGGASELRAIDDAIEICVKQMNLFVRPIARSRIRKPLQPSPEMMLAAAPGPTLSISRPDRPTITIPANGQQIRWRDPGGDWFLISLGIDGEVLQQRFEGTSSISFNSYSLDLSGQKLTVHTRIVSRRLPVPIEFNTTYQKTP